MGTHGISLVVRKLFRFFNFDPLSRGSQLFNPITKMNLIRSVFTEMNTFYTFYQSDQYMSLSTFSLSIRPNIIAQTSIRFAQVK